MTTEPGPVPEQLLPSERAKEWGLFEDWCAATGRPPLPPSTETVVAFLVECPAAPATWTKRVRAIAAMALAAGSAPLERTEELRDMLRGRPARPIRQAVTAGQVGAALRALPSHGWTPGWFGRRDRALLVLAHTAGLPYRQIARLTAADISFTQDGTALVATPTGPVTIPPVDDPMVCGPCTLARWIEALDRAVGFQRLAGFLEHAPQVTPNSAHACTTPITPGAATLATALLPPADQWGATAIEPDPLRARSLSQLARDHAAGKHAPHRIIQRRTAYAQQQHPPDREQAEPAAVRGPSYTVADWQAGVDRRNADRERLADLDTLLNNLDEKARELERRTAELLESG